MKFSVVRNGSKKIIGGAAAVVTKKISECADREEYRSRLSAGYGQELGEAIGNGKRSIAYTILGNEDMDLSKEEEIRIAADVITGTVPERNFKVYLVVPKQEGPDHKAGLFGNLSDYIRDNFIPPVAEKRKLTFGLPMARGSAKVKYDAAPLLGNECVEDRKIPLAPDAMLCGAPSPELPEDRDDGFALEVFSDVTVRDEDFEEKLTEKLKERFAHRTDTFSEYLLYLIESKHMDNAEVYKRAIVDKKVFSKIKNNKDYHPTKLTALCLCVGARLNLDEAKDLLARAGYAISPCDKTDIVFSYFIENEIYDMIDLDIQLEELGLPCIIS